MHWPWDSASKGNVTNNVTTSSTPACNHTSALFDERLCRLDTWSAMLDIFDGGLPRAVGVSNYNVTHFEEIREAGLRMPSLTQSPFHLYRSATQMDLLSYTGRHGIAFLGYSPFGVPDYHNYTFPGCPSANQLAHPYVLEVANKYGATPAQVASTRVLQSTPGRPDQPLTPNKPTPFPGPSATLPAPRSCCSGSGSSACPPTRAPCRRSTWTTTFARTSSSRRRPSGA